MDSTTSSALYHPSSNMAAVQQNNNGLSQRGRDLVPEASMRTHFTSIWANVYHDKNNPKGIINLGTAENYMMMPVVASFINSKVDFEPNRLDYGHGSWGSNRLRTAMASHMDRYFNSAEKVDPEELLFASGCTAICEMLGFTLFEGGDGILLGKPIYQAFQKDFGLRAK
jgi:1-aminocyclopropane-1-carboxylate synthase